MAKKDYNLAKHAEIDTKNLFVRLSARPLSRLLSIIADMPLVQVVKACQSLTSRNYLKTQFSWQWYYYTLTPEGLDYLREWLHIPAEIVPATHIKQQRSHAPPRGMMGGDDRDRRPGGRGGPPGGGFRSERGGDSGGYRRRDAGDGKEGGAPGEFAPQLYVSRLFSSRLSSAQASYPWPGMSGRMLLSYLPLTLLFNNLKSRRFWSWTRCSSFFDSVMIISRAV